MNKASILIIKLLISIMLFCLYIFFEPGAFATVLLILAIISFVELFGGLAWKIFSK